jgi:hypothetical protein
LCAVPGTDLNLSYESLTSRESKQAILSLGVSDPVAYAEIMAGTSSISSKEPAEDESSLFVESTDSAEVDDDIDHTVEEIAALDLR